MHYKVETTDDGSTTFYNEKFGESYHSSIGAYTEALEKHVKACKITELAVKQDEIKILDVCFGLGYNSGVAIQEALKVNPKLYIEIVGLELDKDTLNLIPELEVPEEYKVINDLYARFSKMDVKDRIHTRIADLCSFGMTLEDLNFKDGMCSPAQVRTQIVLADAREAVKELEANYFDAIFFDPFCAKTCPELWTPEFIVDVIKTAKPGSLTSTYSSARIAKDGFEAAGCKLHEGPKLNRRNGGVVAEKLS